MDVIFLYDNNDIGGEHFEIATNDYIESWFVKEINFRGKQKVFKLWLDGFLWNRWINLFEKLS